MSKRSTVRAGVLLAALMTCLPVVGLSGAAVAADTNHPAPQTGRIVSDDPADHTPHIMDGEVLSIAQVGNLIVVGGSFSRVRNAGSSTDITRRNLFAFDAATGQVSTTFVPNPNGAVHKVLPAADGQTLYAGGAFTSVTSAGAAVAVGRLYRVNAVTGARVASFNPGTLNGQVRDLDLIGNRLWVAGKFTHIQGVAQRYLGTVNATTGTRDPYFTRVVSGAHTSGTPTSVLRITTNPTNDRLIAVGNFDRVDGVERDQFAVFDIGGPTAQLSPYYTQQFQSTCKPQFDSYVFDVQYSPDGSYFVVVTSGGYGGYTTSMAGTSGCDLAARFESGATGSNIRPTWTAYTGGDTTWSVEVTDDVVYVGGHQRWQNNPARGDAIDEGAVSRPGIAALNPVNGLPYSWNPTRTLGVGVKDMMATAEGLYVGSDTDVFAGETRRRMAFFPLAGGAELPPAAPYALPGDVLRVASGQSQLLRRGFDGTQVTSSANAPNGTGWGSAVGAFMVNGVLYTAYSNGSFTRRTFDGQDYGPAVAVNAADQLAFQDDWHNHDVPDITSLFYDRGRVFFTMAGESQLFRRAFEPESDIVGQQRFARNAVSGVSYSGMRGAFVADGRLYYASSNGSLNVADWDGTGAVSGTSSVLAAAGGGWASRVMFAYQGNEIPPPPNQAPVAAFTASCADLACTFDAAASSDPDGEVIDYAWDFGDGVTAQGGAVVVPHEYAAAGTRTVSLTVTDDEGARGDVTRSVTAGTVATPVSPVAAVSTTGNRTSHSIAIPPTVQPGDLLLLFLVANSTAPTYAGPAGWTEIEAVAGDGTVGRAYARTAGPGDAGDTVAVTSSSYAKDVVTLAAYRGAAAVPVTDSAIALQTSTSAAHTTPIVQAPDAQHWAISLWADKSSATSGWSLPGGVTQRATASGSGSGHISAVLADSGGVVPAGPVGALTATANASGSSAVTMTVLVRPAG